MSSFVSYDVAMAVLIGGPYWPMPSGTDLTCQAATGRDYTACGKPAAYLRDVAGYPTAAWSLRCPDCIGGCRRDWLHALSRQETP